MPEVAINLPFDANEIKDIAVAEFRKRLDGLGPLQGAKEYASFHLDFQVKIGLKVVGGVAANKETLAWGNAQKTIPGAEEMETESEDAAIAGDVFQSQDPNEERIDREMPLTIETTDGKGGKTRKKVKVQKPAKHKGGGVANQRNKR